MEKMKEINKYMNGTLDLRFHTVSVYIGRYFKQGVEREDPQGCFQFCDATIPLFYKLLVSSLTLNRTMEKLAGHARNFFPWKN